MIEKPFIYTRCEDGFYDIINTRNHYTYPIGNMEVFVMGIVELLNEQQEQIEEQNEQIEELYKEIDFLTHFIEKQGFKVRRNIG